MSLRTVAGPTDRVVVVGAGLAGLSAALHLRGAGRDVTLLERAAIVGGRVGVHVADDYSIDYGASVLTMPNLIAEALAAVGATFESTVPQLQPIPLSPAYHARFADGTSIDVYSDPELMSAEVEKKCGTEEATRYRRLRSWLSDIFDAEFGTFIDANFDSPLDLIAGRTAAKDFLQLLRIGGFGRLGPHVDRLIKDPNLRRVFTFQALYAGVAPAKALAAYGAIAHMDTSLGVTFPAGGMRNIAAAMADAFTTAGGTLATGTSVASIEFDGRRARSVVCDDGSRHECDALVLTPDLLVTDKLLEPIGLRPRRRVRVSPSAVVVHGTVPIEVAQGWQAQSHHTIDFGAKWDGTFDEIIAKRGRGKVMSDPSLLITRPAQTDPSLLVRRGEAVYEPVSVLAPCPNLVSAPLDWETLRDPYVRELLTTLESRGYKGISDNLQIDRIDTPKTWLDAGMVAGSPFSSAHVFRQTGPFRRRNLVRGSDNIVLAGCGTTPGVGIPPVLISGKLAAERIAGPVSSQAAAPSASSATGGS
ncbi:phytoene desaturase [Antrihabitans sp. YC3-6]|uniref:Phytoene desaturase n=1 Tax=Antrihabitans stalagmiti TaxID=2799499 RepID=A0A934NM56_9NOCA|nr:phytoene desaturase family protein [Antrihabitans stalagmiti]MBJ8337737.1 phytoene desaturase [Antrihabitans stalagmiti]